MSRDRVPDLDTFEPRELTLAGLTEVAADCHRILAAFLVQYRKTPDARHVDALTVYLRGSDVEAWVADWITLPPLI